MLHRAVARNVNGEPLLFLYPTSAFFHTFFLASFFLFLFPFHSFPLEVELIKSS